MDSKEIVKDAEHRMNKTVENIQQEFAKIRTGRASAALLDGVKVSYYGNIVPLDQASTVTIPEPRLISIQPWDRSLIGEIEKAILKSDLGLTPSNDGTFVRIPIPPLNEERRKDLVRMVKKHAEEGRIAIRNVRRDANDHLKKLQKNHEISEDELSVILDQTQEMTDRHTKEIDKILQHKESEIMEV
ncbi:MAG: ribosome recycling factor [Calditrichales bacterium]|nr:MAG: ribosome recycling factor [Calditrichales bacterium]